MKSGVNSSNLGTVVKVRGSVYKYFEKDLPDIHTILLAANDSEIIIEALSQTGARHARGIALTPTQGLERGMEVMDSGGPLKAPVGKGILSRMFHVFRNAIDSEGKVGDIQWRSVHRNPPPLARRSTKSEIFETVIKAIDELVPLERGGKAGLFGGAGVGKAVLLTEMIHNIFRFIQAGMEVSGVMGQMPSRLGYQLTMGTGLSGFEERITNTDAGAGNQANPSPIRGT